MTVTTIRTAGLAAIALLVATAPALAGSWIATWTADPEPTWGSGFPLPTRIPASLKDKTLRQVARVSLGGDKVRVEISNRYGQNPLVIGDAHVALAGGSGAVEPGTDRTLTFGGAYKVVVHPGQTVLSDPADLTVPDLSHVAVSLYLPQETPLTTFHWDGKDTAYISTGDSTEAVSPIPEATIEARVFLTGIQVERSRETPVVVAFGDSITDGDGVTRDGERRWPDILAERLAPKGVAVVNAGISGARILSSGMGEAGRDRFDRDVLAQPGVKAVIVLMGINDIAWPGTAFAPEEPAISAETLTAAYRQLVARAHARGIRIVGATLTPFEGALSGTPLDNYYDTRKDKVRRNVNDWIRTSGAFDAVIDLDAIARDPANPARLRADVDSGDHLHPGDAGNGILVDGIDLDKILGQH